MLALDHSMKTLHFYSVILVLAFCSLVYELLLGQLLSAFLGNTIVRYSITVGLYMSSMGFGALLLSKQYLKKCFVSLLKVEIALSVLGASGVMLLLSLHMFGVEGVFFSCFAHGLIIAIGILTGFEIPLLIAVGNRLRPDSEARVLGVDYVGAFLGAVTFAFFFYPVVGIFLTGLLVAFLNGLAGLSLSAWRAWVEREERSKFIALIVVQFGIVVLLAVLIFNYQLVERLGTSMYLGE